MFYGNPRRSLYNVLADSDRTVDRAKPLSLNLVSLLKSITIGFNVILHLHRIGSIRIWAQVNEATISLF